MIEVSSNKQSATISSRVDKELWDAVRIKAIQDRKRISDLLEEALRMFLKQAS